MAEQRTGQPAGLEATAFDSQTGSRPGPSAREFGDFGLEDEADPLESGDNFQSLRHVTVRVTAVLGKTRLEVGELMKMKAGAVVDLNRQVGEPIDLYVNNRFIARGELIVIDGNIGISVTELIQSESALREATENRS